MKTLLKAIKACWSYNRIHDWPNTTSWASGNGKRNIALAKPFSYFFRHEVMLANAGNSPEDFEPDGLIGIKYDV